MRAQNSIVLGGRFRLIRKIGEGGMGVVWEAVELTQQLPCAIKFVRPESDEEVGRRRFLREAEVLRGVSHPNIVKTYEIGADDDGTPAIVMELLHGESLADRLGRKRYLSVGQTAAILAKVALAVQAAHTSNVVHRDLKPDNVFLCMDARTETDVRVLDFGVAKKVESFPDKLTETGTLVGTPHYMSPEQAGGEKGLDARTDVWAIAVIAFECLTGQMPVAGDNYGQLLARLIRREVTKLSELRPDLPADLTRAIDAGLAPRDQRTTLESIAAVFSSYADASIASPPTTTVVPASAFEWPTHSVTVANPTLVAPAKLPRGALHAVLGFALVAVATCTAGLVVHLQHRTPSSTAAVQGTTTSSETPSSASTTTSSPSSSEAHTSELASAATPPPSPSAIASTTPTVALAIPSAIATPARTTTTTTVAAHASGRPPVKPPPATTGGRLQGGVGGDVPF